MSPGSTLWDAGKGSVPGFGVRRQSKAPSFVLKCRVEGKQRWYTIGRYGAPWTVEQARLEAKKILGRLLEGHDGRDEPDNKVSMSVAEFCDLYMEAARSGAILTRFNRPKRESTLFIDNGRIERHIKPLIGTMALVDVDRATVNAMIRDITIGRTAQDIKTKTRGRAIVRGGRATAARVADLLSGIMSWAVEEGKIPHNPVHGVRRYRGEPKQRFLSSSEYAALGEVIRRGCDHSGRPFHPQGLLIIELLCLTGCRVGEISGLRWSEVDAENNCLRLDATKTGKSLRPIGTKPLALLKSIPRRQGVSYVFPGRVDGSYQGAKREIMRILAEADIHEASSHTLRHSFASVAADLGYADGTIAGLLGHAGRGVTSRYIHRPDKAMADGADAVSDAISQRMG